jgi:hypothetical protein
MKQRAVAGAVLTLAAAGLVAVALSATGSLVAPRPAAWAALAFARAEAVGGGVYLASPRKVIRLRRRGVDPAWSPDGRRLAFIAPGAGGADDLYVVDADGKHKGRLTRTDRVDEASPSWSPDGRHLVVERGDKLVVLRADGTGGRRLVSGLEPAWSPGGVRIAFTDGDNIYLIPANGGRAKRVTTALGAQTAPAWAPDGRRLAYVSDQAGAPDIHVLELTSGRVTPLTADAALDSAPAFTANGRNVVFTSSRTGSELLWRTPAAGPAAGPTAPLVSTPSATSVTVRPEPRVVQLLPDFEQRPPTDLSITTIIRGERRHHLLGFDSATDNIGLGPVAINARRSSRRVPFMRASQVVRLATRGRQTFPRVGVLRYVYSSSHSHWHVMGFQRYELRRASSHALLLRDRKSGFCLADHYAHAPGRFAQEPRGPVFTGYCEQGRPEAMSVHQGTSVGYTDRYPSHFHGQSLDLTGVKAGTYVLVHRANRRFRFRELRYENNAASLRIRIGWPRGRSRPPSVRILRTCPGSDRC